MSALLVDRFTRQRQEIMRRLIGVELFDRLILPRMANKQSLPLHERSIMDRCNGLGDEPVLEYVYPDLPMSVFAHPELQKLGLSARTGDTAWLHDCYSFLLMPDCIRLTKAATVALGQARSEDSPADDMYRLLQRLPAVEDLSIHREPHEVFAQLPEWRWDEVSKALPRLRTLNLQNVQVRCSSVLRPLLTAQLGELRSLAVDTKERWVLYSSDNEYTDEHRFTFQFPPRSPHSSTAAADSADHGAAGLAAVQLRLRLALCRDVLEYVRYAEGRVGRRYEYLSDIILECSAIERELLAQQQAHIAAEALENQTRAVE